MTWCINQIVRLVLAGRRAYTRKWVFLGVFVVVFLGFAAILGRLDLLPEKRPSKPSAPAVVVRAGPVISSVTTSSKVVANVALVSSKPTASAELPAKIVIPKINLSVSVQNPTALTVAVLDQELLKGSVRYPTSAKLGEMGNMVIFGHSSYLPVVHNQAFKAFNGIQKLSSGDAISVYSSGRVYTYRVRSMEKESANSDGISLAARGSMLTLATCDSFGEKTDRFVVTADFVESHPVST